MLGTMCGDRGYSAGVMHCVESRRGRTVADLLGTKKFVRVFLEKVTEHIEYLEKNLLHMETDPENTERIQAAFRSCHTIEGSFLSMGFSRLGELAHVMANLLECVSNSSLGVSPSTVDLLLRGVHTMKRLRNDMLQLGSEPDLDISDLVSSLKSCTQHEILSPPTGSCSAKKRDSAPTHTAFVHPVGDCAKKDFLVRVRVVENCSMKEVRAYLVINRLQDMEAEVISITPPFEDLEAENFGRDFSVMVRAACDPDQLAACIRTISEIEEVQVSPLRKEKIPSQPVQETVESREKPRLNHRQKKAAWVAVEQLDSLLDLVGELLIDCSQLKDNIRRLNEEHNKSPFKSSLDDTITHMSLVANELQTEIMKARMIPLTEVFHSLPPVVRDLARTSGKEIDFSMEGEETELDCSILEEMSNPLIHLLQNAIDHGIEEKNERKRAGKPERGHIFLKAYQEEGSVVIMVKDDGMGIPLSKVRSSALEMGLFTPENLSNMTDREIIEIIFHPDFSMKNRGTDVSTRGSGMDMVKRTLKRAKGQVCIQSAEGRGTTVSLRLPLTLDVVRALIVRTDGAVYALPLSEVVEIEKIHTKETHRVNTVLTTIFRGNTLSLFELRELLSSRQTKHPEEKETPEFLHAIVVNTTGGRAGLVVEEIMGKEGIVIQTLGSCIGDTPGLRGAAILGDGGIALVLDVAGLFWNFPGQKANDRCPEKY